MNLDTVEQAKRFAYEAHKKVGQTYGSREHLLPYSFHLDMVAARAHYYRPLLADPKEFYTALVACYLHDVIEDCRVTYNDLKRIFGTEVADIVYAVTSENGKNRDERNSRTYPKIKANKLAIFVKLCDRWANTAFSFFCDSESSMAGKYVAEWPKFYNELWIVDFNDLFEDYEKVFIKPFMKLY